MENIDTHYVGTYILCGNIFSYWKAVKYRENQQVVMFVGCIWNAVFKFKKCNGLIETNVY